MSKAENIYIILTVDRFGAIFSPVLIVYALP